MSLNSIGYKYNYQKVLSFIATEYTGIKTSDVPYLSKYPYQSVNVVSLPIPRPLFMYKFFVYVNEVESHKKSIEYNLALENYWVTQCGWMWLCTTVDMVMTIHFTGNYFVVELIEINYQRTILPTFPSNQSPTPYI